MAREVDIDVVKSAHKGHWFDAGAIRFFNSRIARSAFEGARSYFFVSSERREHYTPRLYSVRRCDKRTGDIDTIGAFQGYETGHQASAVARRLADEEK